jgi:ketosteroid isomerase-like protein
MSADLNDVDKIREKTEHFFAALGRNDVSAIEDMHTDNAVILPPNRRIVQGDNIKALWRNMAPRFQNLQSTITSVDAIGAEAARGIGRFRFRPQREEAEPIIFKYLMLWQKVDGEWKISSMVWNRRENDQQRRRGGGQGGGGGRRQQYQQ